MNTLIEQLPHRAPFVFVSRVMICDGERFEAEWQVDGTEDFFRGHFPSDPIVPGVLLIESMAQTAGMSLIARYGDTGCRGMLVHSEIRFRIPVRPPAVITLHASELTSVGQLFRLSVAAIVAGVVAAEGTVVLSTAGSAAATPDV